MSSNRIKSQQIHLGEQFVLPVEQTRVTKSQAKVQQILEETDLKAQEIITQAENKTQIIVETANTEAERIIEEARKKAEEEYETIKSQAYEEGFKKGEEDGFNKFQNDAQEGIQALETLAGSTFDMKKNIIDSATRDIVDLVSAIADKVCHLSFDDEVLHKITIDAIKQLKDKENITIIVSPQLVENVNNLIPEFRNEIHNLQTLKVLEDNSLSVDGVIVKTPDIRLDSRVSSQINEIARKMLTGAGDELEQE